LSSEIERLREQIAGLDRDLVENLKRRFHLAARVGALKAEEGQPVVVREVEERVLRRAREAATLCGTSPEVMESIFAAIVRGSVERQYRDRLESGREGGARILVLGAGGAMGGWLCRFLGTVGHETAGVDPAWKDELPASGRYAELSDVPNLGSYDAVLVSVPLETTASVLDSLAEARVRAPVVEIASIKSHLREPLRRIRAGGAPAISLHPMFGPGKGIFEALPVVHAVIDDEAAERSAILDLMAHPYLDLVSLPFDHHDRLFAGSLSRSGLDPKEMERTASTTFSRQASTARSILEEDPDLYFAIQRLNPFRGEVYAALAAALEELTGAVENDDPAAFADFLSRAAKVLPPR